MPSNVGITNPSSALADSLVLFSKSAHQAFAEVENQARQDITKAISDASEARSERDKALEALNVSQIASQALQKEVASLKATLKQTELSVSHLKETVAQLRREATQWKDQSRNWQEHFTRVEQERCSLTTRVEELVAEQLSLNRSLPTPFTPNHPGSHDVETVSISNPIRASTSSRKHPISPSVFDSPSASTKPSRRRTSKSIKSKYKDTTPSHPVYPRDPSTSNPHDNAQHYQNKISPESPSRPPSRTTVIRRVHAVIDVKQEPSDEESVNLDAEETIVSSATRRAPPRKRKTIHHNEDYVSGEESDQLSFASDQYNEDDDDHEQEVADDDDDELMLSAGNDELYSQRGRSLRSTQGQSTSPPKKRRVATGRDKPSARRKF